MKQPETPRFHVYSDMGTVTCKTQYTVQSDNKLILKKERFLDAWRKINGRWQLVIRHSIAVQQECIVVHNHD
ncbi:nuclear transport factor 2 family protein [Synechococcus sp. A10-1-5-9]|uniref:nuclear transport factor 2 family protein n=1 Tax=Synechococcus sp. A10-1-5-9 TaxID=3392295 RepID=UPI0039E9B448